MEAKVPEASFNFVNFKVIESYLQQAEGIGVSSNLNFEVSGAYQTENQKYTATISLRYEESNESESTILVVITSQSEFIFSTNYVPEFFYKNAIAIIFPYIRSYIAGLTSLSGNLTIMLPLLNVTSLSDQLKENTIIQP